MSRHGAHGKGGRGDAKSGGGRRIPQLERKDTGSGVLNTGSVERSLITLTVSINADDLRKFFLVLGNHAASSFDTGVVERVFLEIPTYKYKMPDFPREPLPDDEEEVEEDNPDFDPEVEESADNPRLILVSKKIYTQNHIGLTVEGKRRLDVAVRMWERELTKRDKKIDAVQLELRRGFRLAYSHMDESAKSHMTTNFGKEWDIYDENDVTGLPVLVERIRRVFGRGAHTGLVVSQIDLLRLKSDVIKIFRRENENPSDFAVRIRTAIAVFRSAFIGFGTNTDQQRAARTIEFDARHGESFQVDVFICGIKLERYEYKLKHESATTPFPTTLSEAVAQAEQQLRSQRDDPTHRMLYRNAFMSKANPSSNKKQGGGSSGGSAGGAKSGGKHSDDGGGKAGSESKRETITDDRGDRVCFSFYDHGTCTYQKETGKTCRFAHTLRKKRHASPNSRAGGGPAPAEDVQRAVQEVRRGGVSFRDGDMPPLEK